MIARILATVATATSLSAMPLGVGATANALPAAPLQPPPGVDLPTPAQLSRVLYGIADPSVPFVGKSDLVENGVGGVEGAVADGGIQIAALKGELPLDFAVSDIDLVSPGKVRATVVVTGPQLKGVTKRLTFFDQDGWRLQHVSAMTLLQATSSAQRG